MFITLLFNYLLSKNVLDSPAQQDGESSELSQIPQELRGELEIDEDDEIGMLKSLFLSCQIII